MRAGTKDADGNVIYVGNIDASGSGVIGSNVKLEASGDIKGLVFARGNLNVDAIQNVNVTALAIGSANVTAGDTISGTIIGMGSVNVSGASVDASLLSQNVTASGDVTSSQMGFAQGNAAGSTSQGLQSDDVAKTVADARQGRRGRPEEKQTHRAGAESRACDRDFYPNKTDQTMTTLINPMFASNAAVYAIQNATMEGKLTVIALLALSLFSWSIIISKFRQLNIARRAAKKFFAAYASTRDPLDIKKRSEEFDGAPAFELYHRGAEELDYQLQKNPVTVKGERRISPSSFEAVKVVLEEAASAQAMALEKGMIVLSTAVAGGPFIGLLGTVWGVMSTFAGIAEKNSASLTAMAPGRCGGPGRHGHRPARGDSGDVRLQLHGDHHPAKSRRNSTALPTRYANQIEHTYVDNRDIEDKIAWALTRVEMGENTPAI